MEGVQSNYCDKQNQIERAQQNNNMYSEDLQGGNSLAMRNPEIYSAKMIGRSNLIAHQQPQQRAPSNYQGTGDLLAAHQSGREKSMYQIEFQQKSTDILPNVKSKPVDSMSAILRNPVSYRANSSNKNNESGQKMISEKKYQEQLVLSEVQKFKEQKVLLEQDKRKRELDYRERDIAKRQIEADQLRQLQLQQEDKLKKEKEVDEMRSQFERERQIRLKQEIEERERILQDKEKELKQKEIYISQAPSRNIPPSNSINIPFPQLPQNIETQLQQSQQYESQQLKSKTSSLHQLLGSQNESQLQSFAQKELSQSSVLNSQYQPPQDNYQKIDTTPSELGSQRRSVPSNRSQMVARSLLSPMKALLSQPENKPKQTQLESQNQNHKPIKILAVVDTDNKSRDDASRFFQVRGIQEFQVYGLPGGPVGLANDKGWLDSFFSSLSFMRSIYDFSDIFIFSSTESPFAQVWFQQAGNQNQQKLQIKQFHISNLKLVIEQLKQRVPQSTKIQGILLEQRGLSERVV